MAVYFNTHYRMVLISLLPLFQITISFTKLQINFIPTNKKNNYFWSMRNKQSIFILNFAKLIVWAYQQGYELTAGELHRTEEQHQFNLKAGKSKAKRSRHQDRLAGDLNLFVNGVYRTDTASYKPLGDYWVSLHHDNVWGGDFNKDGNKTTNDAWDGNHFEMR